MTKQEIKNIINTYVKEHNISKKKYSLFPVYIHLNGFSHSIGFTNHATRKDVICRDYNTVAYSGYTGETWGYLNEYQKQLAERLLSKIPHYCYQNNAKEIIF